MKKTNHNCSVYFKSLWDFSIENFIEIDMVCETFWAQQNTIVQKKSVPSKDFDHL